MFFGSKMDNRGQASPASPHDTMEHWQACVVQRNRDGGSNGTHTCRLIEELLLLLLAAAEGLVGQ